MLMDSFTNTFIFNSNTCLVLQMSFHERKEERTDRNLKKVEAKPRTESAAPEMSKKFEDKIQKIEENICQWIDDEAKSLKDHLEKDICSIRNEVDNKNIEMNSKVQSITSLYITLNYSKVQSSIHALREEFNSRGAAPTDKYEEII